MALLHRSYTRFYERMSRAVASSAEAAQSDRPFLQDPHGPQDLPVDVLRRVAADDIAEVAEPLAVAQAVAEQAGQLLGC